MKQSGFILFIILSFLLIFALTSLYSLQQAKNALKLYHLVFLRNEKVQSAKEVLNKIENQLMTKRVTCLVPIIPYHILSLQPQQWWQTNACQWYQNYAYVIEYLGKDPCASINKAWMASYYRITLTTLPIDVNNARILLQSTMAKAIDKDSPCLENTHNIAVGRQMIREL